MQNVPSANLQTKTKTAITGALKMGMLLAKALKSDPHSQARISREAKGKHEQEECKREKMQSRGLDSLFKGRQLLGIPNAQPRRYRNDMPLGNSQERLAINALPPFRPRAPRGPMSAKSNPSFKNNHF